MKTSSLLLLAVLFASNVFAQTNQEKAKEKVNEAIEHVDDGDIKTGIKLLQEAQKLDPEDIDITYEIAYAYYLDKDYKKAVSILEKIKVDKKAKDYVFQLLGNAYDNLGKSDDALAVYKEGLKRYSNSGRLYLEQGVLWMGKKEYNKALDLYEEGIKADPDYASNYYWAAKIYCNSSEKVWGMIYGEIFMNLERGSKRTAEISKLLYDTYKSQITFPNDSSTRVDLTNSNVITEKDLKAGKLKLPYQTSVYVLTLTVATGSARKINLKTLDQIRTSFLDTYYSMKHDKEYPNALFEYEQKVKAAGHLQAYNYWLLSKGDDQGFDNYLEANKEKYEQFIAWYKENAMVVDDEHKFHSSQYN